MKKLTNAQEIALNRILDYINLAKQHNNFKDYWLAEQLQGLEQRKDFEELKNYYEGRFNPEIEKTYKHYWEDARNNIALTTCVSSATLRVLEKLGYIQILKDGGSWVDKVKLLRTDLLKG